MISKEDAKVKLQKAGYVVVDDNAILTILIPENANIKNTIKDVTQKCMEIGYSASFGVKQHKFSEGELESAVENEEQEDIEDTEEKLTDSVDEPEEKPANKTIQEDEYLDEEDENPDEELEMSDMNMILNSDSVQFSLEDFGMM